MKEPTEEEFQDALDNEDELGLVIRAHIHIEHHLIKIIESLVQEPESLTKMELDYEKCVHLAIALGLKEMHRPPLLTLGSIRNKFAHQLQTKIDKNMVNNLYNSFSSEDKKLIAESMRMTAKNLGEEEPKLRKLEPRTQFIFMAVTLRSVLLAARKALAER